MITESTEKTPDEEVVYEEIPQPHVIETGDSVKVKQVLDDATTEILVAKGGFEPNYSWENIKLFLMFLSCVFAMIAQFFQIPFPDSRPLLGVCCAVYFIISGVLQLMITYIDKDIIMISKPDPVSYRILLSIAITAPYLIISSHLISFHLVYSHFVSHHFILFIHFTSHHILFIHLSSYLLSPHLI